jgi:diaminopimelate decarboxylase
MRLEYRHEFSKRYPDTQVIYTCKAANIHILPSFPEDDGLELDMVSDGEISIAKSAAFPSEGIYFHCSNNIREELNALRCKSS